MVHLGVELDRKHLFVKDLIGGIADIGRRGDDFRTFREGRNRVPMGHPHLRLRRHAFEERGGDRGDFQDGSAVFPGQGAFHPAAAAMGDVLRPVADAKHRNLAPEGVQGDLRCVGVSHRAGAARQDDPADVPVQRRHLVEGMDFAENVQFPEAPTDQLRHLGTAIQNDDPFHNANLRFAA